MSKHFALELTSAKQRWAFNKYCQLCEKNNPILFKMCFRRKIIFCMITWCRICLTFHMWYCPIDQPYMGNPQSNVVWFLTRRSSVEQSTLCTAFVFDRYMSMQIFRTNVTWSGHHSHCTSIFFQNISDFKLLNLQLYWI